MSKRYAGATKRYGSLRHDLEMVIRKAVLGERTVRAAAATALDRVSFEVEEGEAFALIGPNGAGKTTALKLLARISRPTEGRILLRGSVGALIEVGSGVHPELTGRENIWLYGRIMGMARPDIMRQFDSIVDFAELGHVLDVPVKMYSSGMQLRLAFAIASHVNPDIFIVDEALAVGDAYFQTKCIERMMQLISSGKTLLFVSHNLPAVEAICRRGLLLREGRVVASGGVRDVLRHHIDWTNEQSLRRWRNPRNRPPRSQVVEVVAASCHNSSGGEQYEFWPDDSIEIRIRFRANRSISRPHVNIGITDGRPGLLINCSTLHSGRPPELVSGEWTAACKIARLGLLPRAYQVWCDVYTEHGHGVLAEWQEVGGFRICAGDIIGFDGKLALSLAALSGAVKADFVWTHTLADSFGGS